MSDAVRPRVADVGPIGALDGIERTFDRARQAAGEVVAPAFKIAGDPVSLRFAGGALAELLTTAFAHLPRDDATQPRLTVRLWDSESTGTEPPPLPPTPSDGPFGAFYYFGEGPYRVLYQPGPNALSMLDTSRGLAWYWVESAERLSHWEAAAPLRHVLQWWLSSTGRQQVHGGAVGTLEGGVLIVGKGGSGKSTATLSTLDSDLLYAGDDYVAVTLEGTPYLHSMYSSGKVEPHHLSRLPHLGTAVWNADRLEREKAVVFVHRHWPERTATGFPLRAVLVPRVVDSRTEPAIAPVSRASALAALAPSTIFQLHPSGQEALAAMARVIERVPTFALELGSDIPAIPQAISEFLSR